MSKKTFLMLLTLLVVLAWPASRLVSQAVLRDPIPLRDRQITLTESGYAPDGSVTTALREELLVRGHSIYQKRKAIVPALQVDDTFHQIQDFDKRTTTVWVAGTELKNTIKLNDLSLAEREMQWTRNSCMLAASAEDGNDPEDRISMHFLGEAELADGIVAYGIEQREEKCSDCETIAARITTIYLAPELACAEVLKRIELIGKDGIQFLAFERKIIAANSQTVPELPPIPDYPEASRAKVIQALYKQRGKDWPATPKEMEVYSQIDSNYQRHRP